MLRDRLELIGWGVLALAGFVCLILLIGGCRGPDGGARLLDSIEVGYSDGGGRTHSAFSGMTELPYGQDPPFSGDSSGDYSMHAVTVSIRPFSGLYDPEARTRELIDAMYQAQLERDRKARELPFVEHAPEAAAAGTANASSGLPGGNAAASPPPAPHELSHSDLPWWKDTALLIGYATILGAIVAGAIQGWKKVKTPKE